MERDQRIKALKAFAGRWTAKGTSFGWTDQSGDDPKANGQPWFSTHDGCWHTGKFFLVQDEKADIAGDHFDTLSVMGIGEDGDYFARLFKSHGFYRHYRVERDRDTWTLSRETERATIIFQDGGKTQVLAWEWKKDRTWLPLCDRTATRVD